jgi:hypothetical protein
LEAAVQPPFPMYPIEHKVDNGTMAAAGVEPCRRIANKEVIEK